MLFWLKFLGDSELKFTTDLGRLSNCPFTCRDIMDSFFDVTEAGLHKLWATFSLENRQPIGSSSWNPLARDSAG